MAAANITIQELVAGYAAHQKELLSPETNEAAVRQNYIDPFWRALGWDIGDAAQRGPAGADVIIEKIVQTVDANGMRNRRPDYLFRLGGFPRFIVEAKKPSGNLEDKEAVFQAKQYAWNSTIPFAVLTDFAHFRLYDTTLKPIFHDPVRGLINEFSLNFDQYAAQWDLLKNTFGRDAVADGSLERLLADKKRLKANRRLRTPDRALVDLRGGEPVDRVFLAYLDAHRRQFAAQIYRDNKNYFADAHTLHGAAKLTEAVQRIMDRLVFMRICEDRGIMPFGELYRTLERIVGEGGNLYASLAAKFRDLDIKYNGYLYKPHFSEQLIVAGDALADFIRTLYPPEAPWDFAAIGDDILGIVYERFLGNVVTVRNNQAAIEEKPEVRHAGGVYYTPRFVVDTIIRRVVGPQVAGKTPAQVLNVKILDPACGSGSFLVAALQYLFDYCMAEVRKRPALANAVVPAAAWEDEGKPRRKKAQIAFMDKHGTWSLAPDFRAALLTHCIYGVDIDQQAAEVTIMSLYLKMLESRLPDNWATLWVERQLLPILENNIRCGNSLIDEEGYFAFREKMFRNQGSFYNSENADTKFRINRFDWTSRTRGFGRLLDSQAAAERGGSGFDCIVGNPPYIRVQELKKWAPEECEFYKWRYKSAAKGNYDIYVVFTEKALSLLAPRGLLGFIMPHKFWQSQYGEGLRGIVGEGKHLQAVLDFGDQQVFKGATTYTAVHVLSKEPGRSTISYGKIIKLGDAAAQCEGMDAGKRVPGAVRFEARSPRGINPWVFSNRAVAKWAEAVRANHKTLGEIARKIAQGIVTSCDDVYFLTRRGRGYFSDASNQCYDLERAVIHPLLKGSVHMKRFVPVASDRFVLFPYETFRGQWRLIPTDKFASTYPRAWAYLNEFRTQLEGRESGKMVGRHDWYAYVYPKNLEVMSSAKLLVPAIATHAQYCVDVRGEYYFVGSGGGGGGGYGIVTDAVDLRYLCGLLNSKCLDRYLRHVSTPFHSGWFAYSKLYLSQIPILLPATLEEKKLAERITESVDMIIGARIKLQAQALSDREKSQCESELDAHERRVDDLVQRLYGVESVPE